MSNPSVSYVHTHVRAHDFDRFLAALFVPEPAREGLLTLAAFNVELAQIRHSVTEEMLAAIRYAWWQEAVDALYGGQVRAAPVLQALKSITAQVPQAQLNRLIDSYREAYPVLPPQEPAIMQEIGDSWLNAANPSARKAWDKANNIIACHRRRYGAKARGWLAFKLLLAGIGL